MSTSTIGSLENQDAVAPESDRSFEGIGPRHLSTASAQTRNNYFVRQALSESCIRKREAHGQASSEDLDFSSHYSHRNSISDSILSPDYDNEDFTRDTQASQDQKYEQHADAAATIPNLRPKTVKTKGVVHWSPTLRKIKIPPSPQRKFTIMNEMNGASGIFMRKALKSRGWIEQSQKNRSRKPSRKRGGSKSSLQTVSSRQNMSKSSSKTSSKNFIKFPTSMDLLWTVEGIKWETVSSSDTIVNQIPTPIFSFASKVGILACAQRSHWFHERNATKVALPRCYRLFIDEEMHSFIGDFCLTAAIGLLEFIKNKKAQPDLLFHEDGRVESSCIHFAMAQVEAYVSTRQHEDIDAQQINRQYDSKWASFLRAHNKIIYGNVKIKVENSQEAHQLMEKVEATMKKLVPYWPQLPLDGVHNLWICKPGEASQGAGILVMNSLSKILKTFTTCKRNWDNSIVQKYIERPLLIYGTKFDIRQWFLVTSWYPLIVWFYKDSYLRFCSKPFDMLDFHERVHLCNYSVQSRYKIDLARDSRLPKDNMWSNSTFQEYLKQIGQEGQWEKKIYRDMQREIMGILLPSQEYFSDRNTPIRRNCFQLYGADFMLTEGFETWLIEINRFPLISGYPPLMKQLCEQCIEDCMKVVIDRRDDPRANTGRFECIYNQRTPVFSLFPLRYDLIIKGRGVTGNRKSATLFEKDQSVEKIPRRVRTALSMPMNVTKTKTPVPARRSCSRLHQKQRQGESLQTRSLGPLRSTDEDQDGNGNELDLPISICASILRGLVGSAVGHSGNSSSRSVELVGQLMQTLINSAVDSSHANV